MPSNVPERPDLAGRKFGRLTVKHRVPERTTGKHRWQCACDCGAEKEVNGQHLLRGSIMSCGCLKRGRLLAANLRHGMTGSPTHVVWRGMIQRCTNPRNPNFPSYGGKGVTVCQRWLDSFEAFYEDMGERPAGLTLDRIDGSKPYEPGNCRWATRADQAVNRGVVTMLTINGRTQCLSHWLKETGVCRAAFWRRVKAGWLIEDAVSIKGLKSQHYHLRNAA